MMLQTLTRQPWNRLTSQIKVKRREKRAEPLWLMTRNLHTYTHTCGERQERPDCHHREP